MSRVLIYVIGLSILTVACSDDALEPNFDAEPAYAHAPTTGDPEDCTMVPSSDDSPDGYWEAPHVHCDSQEDCVAMRSWMIRSGYTIASNCYAEGTFGPDGNADITSWSFSVVSWPEDCDIELEPFCHAEDEFGPGYQPPA